MAFFSSAASLGSSMRFTVRSSSGRRFFERRRLFLGHRLHVGIGGHAPRRPSSSRSALRHSPIASTSGPRSAYSLEAATNFCESSLPPDSAACSSACRATIWSSFCSRRHVEPQAFSASARASSATSRCVAAVEVLELRHALGELVVAEDDGGAGVELVGALHAPFHVAAIVLLDGDAGAAQRAGDAERLGLGRGARAARSPPARGSGRRLVAQHHQPLDAARPADAGGRRAAQLGDQPVIAAAAQHRALGADVAWSRTRRRCGCSSRGRAPGAGSTSNGDAGRASPSCTAREEILARLVQVVGEGRRVGVDRLVALVLAVEDAQRIALQALARILRRAWRCGPSSSRPAPCDRRCGSRGSPSELSLSTQRSRMPSRSRMSAADRDHLDVGAGLGRAQHLEVDLVELALAALLRPLVAEHRPGGEELQRQLLGRAAVGHEGAADAGGVFRPQGERLAAAILRRCTSPW